MHGLPVATRRGEHRGRGKDQAVAGSYEGGNEAEISKSIWVWIMIFGVFVCLSIVAHDALIQCGVEVYIKE